MIVKDERQVIARCLESVKPLIDCWVIVDTGSTDGTQEVIRESLKGIPGELYERPWKNFGHNRNEALELAKNKADYILFMDADDLLQYETGYRFPPLTEDLYRMWQGTAGFSYLIPHLVRSNLPWKWVGVVHEYLDCDVAYTMETLGDIRYFYGADGSSHSDPEKFRRYIAMLEEGVKSEPNNSRYAFYLAESYRGAGERGKALEWYQKVVQMRGWDQEVFCALLQSGHMARALGLPPKAVIECYEKAHQFRLHRVEPIYYIIDVLNSQKEYAKAFIYLKLVEQLPVPKEKDALFNEDWIGNYGFLFQMTITGYYVGHYQEALDASDRLLAMADLPADFRKHTIENRAYALNQLRNAPTSDAVSSHERQGSVMETP